MPYWRLFYHLIWATKNRESLIRDVFSMDLHNVIAGKSSDLGAFTHAVGGMEDHIHLVASVPPRISIFEFVQQLKGSSSHFANHVLVPAGSFAWQAEFGVVSFSGRRLDVVVQYVKNQPRHHRDGTTISVLERIIGEDRTASADIQRD